MPALHIHTLSVQHRPAQVWRGGQGPALMLIHGGLGDAALHWETVWEPLAETFTVAAPNLPSAQPPHVPTLLLWGDADRMTPVSRGQALVRSIPSARLQPILGAGHMPQLDKPTDFVDVVKRFISR